MTAEDHVKIKVGGHSVGVIGLTQVLEEVSREMAGKIIQKITALISTPSMVSQHGTGSISGTAEGPLSYPAAKIRDGRSWSGALYCPSTSLQLMRQEACHRRKADW